MPVIARMFAGASNCPYALSESWSVMEKYRTARSRMKSQSS
jgi:hypothetical protein